MWRTRGIAMTVALAGHALAMIGIGKVGFSIADAEPSEPRLFECALVIESPAEAAAAQPPATEPSPPDPQVTRTGRAWGSGARAAADERIASFRLQMVDAVQSSAALAQSKHAVSESAGQALSSRIVAARDWLSDIVNHAHVAAAQARTKAAERALAREHLASPNSPATSLASAAAPTTGPTGTPSAAPIANGSNAQPQDTSAHPPAPIAGPGGGTAIGPVPAGSNRAPTYPVEALRRRIEGVVVVRAEVNTRGSVTTASILETAGAPSLDASALEAVRSWRFEPGKDAHGRAAPSRADVPVVFRLRQPDTSPGRGS